MTFFKSPVSEASQASEKNLEASVEMLGNFVDQRDGEDNRGDGKGRGWAERKRAGGRK